MMETYPRVLMIICGLLVGFNFLLLITNPYSFAWQGWTAIGFGFVGLVYSAWLLNKKMRENSEEDR